MKKYKVNLNIITPNTIEEKDVCALFDDIVYFIHDKNRDNNIIWVLDFELNINTSIENQIKIISSHVIEEAFDNLINKGGKVLFDILIYYDTYTCSFNPSFECLELLTQISKEAEINFSLYPTDFTDEA